MDKNIIKNRRKIRRASRIRATISGTALCPRLSVFRSNKGIYAQIIDDQKGITLASVKSDEVKAAKKDGKTESSFELGKILAKKASEKKINKVVFDRGGNKYHGRIKSFAEGAREAGLNF